MADLATFADGLVHDIRNPLNVLRSNLYLLRQRLPEDPRTERALTRMDDQVTAALRLLEGVQAFYRADRPSMQRVQVNDLVRSVVESTPSQEGATVTLELADGLPMIPADPQLLDAALRALLRNAMDAVLQGGSVVVSTSTAEDTVSISVQDSGDGVPEEVLSQIFQPFFTTRRGRSGLGLPLVAKVARAHGGSARVLTGGQGTRVELRLPIESASAS
ncbi:MAG: sensor histidine kinase [Armatimonadota bacterium]